MTGGEGYRGEGEVEGGRGAEGREGGDVMVVGGWMDDLIAPKDGYYYGIARAISNNAGRSSRPGFIQQPPLPPLQPPHTPTPHFPLLSAQSSASKGRATVVTALPNEDANERFDVFVPWPRHILFL